MSLPSNLTSQRSNPWLFPLTWNLPLPVRGVISGLHVIPKSCIMSTSKASAPPRPCPSSPYLPPPVASRSGSPAGSGPASSSPVPPAPALLSVAPDGPSAASAQAGCSSTLRKLFYSQISEDVVNSKHILNSIQSLASRDGKLPRRNEFRIRFRKTTVLPS